MFDSFRPRRASEALKVAEKKKTAMAVSMPAGNELSLIEIHLLVIIHLTIYLLELCVMG